MTLEELYKKSKTIKVSELQISELKKRLEKNKIAHKSYSPTSEFLNRTYNL